MSKIKQQDNIKKVKIGNTIFTYSKNPNYLDFVHDYPNLLFKLGVY